jgi:hypothetical protein
VIAFALSTSVVVREEKSEMDTYEEIITIDDVPFVSTRSSLPNGFIPVAELPKDLTILVALDLYKEP